MSHSFKPLLPALLRKRRLSMTTLAANISEDYYAVRRAIMLRGEYLNMSIMGKILDELGVSIQDAIGQEPDHEQHTGYTGRDV